MWNFLETVTIFHRAHTFIPCVEGATNHENKPHIRNEEI